MSFVKFNNVGIQFVSAAVPKERIVNKDLPRVVFTEAEINNTVKTTGIEERRKAREEICSSDLCYEAATTIFNSGKVSRDEVDALIFVSQTPDFKQPNTSGILQDRLELKKSTLAFDVNMACSGFVYGLFLAYSIAHLEGIRNVLLLIGETMTKITSSEDKATGLLFGDAGAALIISKSERHGKTFFSLNSDGSGANHLIVPAGGFRMPSTPETLQKQEFHDGSLRTFEEFFMDGMEIFNFTMHAVPKDIQDLMEHNQLDLGLVDKVIFHQANKYMTNFFTKKLKINPEKVLYSIEKFGNTSGVSIPLTMVYQKDMINSNESMLFSGFGAGLSWGTAYVEKTNCEIFPLQEI